MPRNGSGTFTLVTGNPVVSGTIIESTWANTTLADIADSLTNSLARNGEGGMTAPLRLVDGTVSVPGLAFANETGSGLYRAAAGDVGLAILGSRILRLQAAGASVAGTLGVTGATNLATSSGNVGIGTASPAFKLDVAGTGSIGGDLDVAGSVFRKQASGTGYLIYGTNGATNNGLYYDQTNSAVSLWTVSAQRLTIDSNGNAGFATASPAGRVDAVANAYGAFVARSASAGTNVDVIGFKAVDSAAANFANVAYQAKSHVWGYNGSTLGMVLDSSGNVGIGTSTPAYNLDVTGTIGVSSAVTAINVNRTDGAVPNQIAFRSAGVTRGFVGATSGTGLIFSGAAGQGFATIDNAGAFIVGRSYQFSINTPDDRGFFATQSGETVIYSDGTPLYIGKQASDGIAVNFRRAGVPVGSISLTATATAYNTSSDYRLKEDVAPMTGALAKVAALKPVTYKWKADGSDGQGFIAHELQEIAPGCVTGTKDAVEAIGNTLDLEGNVLQEGVVAPTKASKFETWVKTGERPVYQGVDTSFLVATLVAAVQELKAEVDALKAISPA